jgi:hypothetical protein
MIQICFNSMRLPLAVRRNCAFPRYNAGASGYQGALRSCPMWRLEKAGGSPLGKAIH